MKRNPNFFQQESPIIKLFSEKFGFYISLDLWKNQNFWIFPQCLSFGLWFGIVWCWRSISYFRSLASLPYMSIRAGVVVAVALHEIDYAPNAKPCSKCDNKCLQNVYCAVEKCHEYILSAASAAVRQADKRRSAIGRRRIKKPPCIKAVSPRCVTSAARRYSVVRVWAVRCPVGARIR